jgi:hypothetical protein
LINNRQQTGRRRGRGGQNGQRQQNGRPEMGNRIDNRARGNAPQLLEKYKTLARDAQQSGDRVLAEYYFQFADHYFRVLAESRARYEEANPNRPRQDYGDQDNEGFDGDGNEGDSDGEFEAPRDARPQPNRSDNRGDQQPRPYRDDRPRSDQNRDERPRNDQNRDDRPRSDQNRDDRPRSDHNRSDQPRQDREVRPERASEDRPQRTDRYQRDERPREDRPREVRPRQDRTRTAAPRAQPNGNSSSVAHDDDFDLGNALPFDALPPAIGVSAMEPVPGVEGETVVVPKKRGRPKKVVAEVTTEE